MGNFYTNVTLAGAALEAVLEALGSRHALVAAVGERILVFDQACESQDPSVLSALCAELSSRVGCTALGVLNHDDDVLMLMLFSGGRLLTDYNSCPGYFDGDELPPSEVDAVAFCAAFGVEQAAPQVRVILASEDDDLSFAADRHQALVDAMALPVQSVGYGYDYLAQGEVPEGLDASDLIETGGDV